MIILLVVAGEAVLTVALLLSGLFPAMSLAEGQGRPFRRSPGGLILIAGSNYQVILLPVAWEAGPSEIGRLGTLITFKFAPGPGWGR
jgi:hypothetical protein